MAEPVTWMTRALALARQARGTTRPNPPVGAILLRDREVVGQGWTQPAGSDHAEVMAIKAAGDRARGATLYVTLEPCNHYGRTPPCTEAIIAAGIAEVHYAIPDRNPLTAGQAADRLRRAGIRIVVGEQASIIERFYRPFFKWITTAQPYVVAKFAASLDGRVATRTGESQWITGPVARTRVQDLRQVSDAILVGAGTVVADNPRLTVRLETSAQAAPCQPLRIVLDSGGRTPAGSAIFDQPGQTLIAGTDRLPPEAEARLRDRGAEVLRLPARDGKVDLAILLGELGRREITTLMVEGGAATLGSFFDQRLVDETWVFLAPIVIGGVAAPGAVGGLGVARLSDALRLEDVELETIDGDFLIRGYTSPTV
ncbi:MAG TPA: bifunctional diaminohydroxyphosphoribosylaminopyrimidine deaminase/5-amino-6-(5-phosphoribosylamino)uracil reductase RibD [Dehalococcoidia bacterium]|nr:bifunctional diaminohydroxyphosphoribosylaminopyrimidine deaminase/5-amino-6-(5-phosphoribosylamino)uracil reductase RibD [Dehalococcoidia bacterium]